MGVGVSHWPLARTVSQNGGLGVVSCTGSDTVLIRRLQLGDPDGHLKRAIDQFPFPEISDRVFNEYFISGGKAVDASFKHIPLYKVETYTELEKNKDLQLTVLANFVEVFLAKEGHDNPVGVNYLEKVQMQHLPSLYGAMLADVDYVLMGAGMPIQIPRVLDCFVHHGEAFYKLDVSESSKKIEVHFDPKKVIGPSSRELKRPDFLAIVSSATLATYLKNKSSGDVNGFILEGSTAGGHNAPPRAKNSFNENGEPIYGPKDEINIDAIKKLGLPFWLAGGYGSPEQLNHALASGAKGIQVGTLFSLCVESGYDGIIKQELINRILEGDVTVFTDPTASPTGFPFKVILLSGTLSEQSISKKRRRLCDLGYLRVLYERSDNSIGYRCPSEPLNIYEKKGGSLKDTIGRKCLCNSLFANIGMAQLQRDGIVEKPLLTAGNDINLIKQVLDGRTSYSAVDVLNYLKS